MGLATARLDTTDFAISIGKWKDQQKTFFRSNKLLAIWNYGTQTYNLFP